MRLLLDPGHCINPRVGPAGSPVAGHAKEARFPRHRGGEPPRQPGRQCAGVSGVQHAFASLPRETPFAAHHHQHFVALPGIDIVRYGTPAQELDLEAGSVPDDALLPDRDTGLILRERHEIPVAGDELGHHFARTGLGNGGETLVVERRHREDAFGQLIPLRGVVEPAVLAEHQAVAPRLLEHFRRPDHSAPRVVSPENRHDHPVVGADVLESPKDSGGDVEEVTLFEHHLARSCHSAPRRSASGLSARRTLPPSGAGAGNCGTSAAARRPRC